METYNLTGSLSHQTAPEFFWDKPFADIFHQRDCFEKSNSSDCWLSMQWLRMQIHHPNYIQLLLPHEKLSRWSIRLELAKRQCIQRQLMAAGCYAGWVAAKEGPLPLTPTRTLLYRAATAAAAVAVAATTNTCNKKQHLQPEPTSSWNHSEHSVEFS